MKGNIKFLVLHILSYGVPNLLLFSAFVSFPKFGISHNRWDRNYSTKNFSTSENRKSDRGQVTTSAGDYFRSKQSGNWNDAGSWESSPDNVNWANSTLFPDQDAKGITIRNEHTITLSENTSAGMLTIDEGGTLDNININGGYLLTIYDDGTPASDFNIYGRYILYGRPPTLNSGATATVYTSGLVRVDNNDIPKSSGSFARSEQVYFQTGAVFEWNTTSKDVFASSNVVYFPNSGPVDIPVFKISQAPGDDIGGGASSPTTFNGLFEANADINFTGGGNKIFRNGICGNATIKQVGSAKDPGNFQITGENAILGGRENLKLDLCDIFNIKSNLEVPEDSFITFIVSSNPLESRDSGRINKDADIIFTINGTADMSIINMDNTSGSVDINGYLKTAALNGIEGNSSSTVTSGTVNVNTGSTVEYNAILNNITDTQWVTSPGILQGSAPDYYNLIISGAGIKTPGAAFSPSGTITIKDDAIFDCRKNNIGGANTSLTMTDNSRLIVGTTGTQPSMEGTYSLTGGVIEFASKNTTRQSIRNGVEYLNIEVTGADSIKNGGRGNVLIKDGGSFKVNSGGVFTINANSIKGVNTPSTAYVEVEGGGTFNSGNTGGFNGRSPLGINDTTSSIHANISDIRLDNGSTVAYIRSNPSQTGDGSQPITTGNFTYQNLVLSGTGNKIAPFKSDLPVNGDFAVKGPAQFVHDSSTVIFTNTSAAQNINTQNVTVPPVFYNLTNQNTQGLNVNNNISVKSVLALGNSSVIYLGDSIRLISDNDQTASVAPIPEGTNAARINYGTGKFIIERYISNHSKAWQLLSVNTKGSTIHDSWQQSVNINDPRPDFAELGFDDPRSYAPSMKYYNPETDSYTGVSSTSDRIDLHPAYFLFVRGDRSAKDIGDPATEVTLFTSGEIYEPGNPPSKVTVTKDQWILVGNPYPSSLDFKKLDITGGELEVGYYIWDPKLTTYPSIYGLGAYRHITPDGNGGYTSVPDDPLYEDGYPPVQSGQAFFVHSSATSTEDSYIGFPESAKASGSFSIFRQGTAGNKTGKIRTNLYIDANSKKVLMDGTLQMFRSDFSNNIDKYDAMKLMNSTENISLPSSVYPLIVERRPYPSDEDTLFYNLSNTGKKNYSLEITVDGIPAKTLDIYFNDAYLKTATLLNPGKNDFDFVINNDKLSAAYNRFYLTFKIITKPFEFSGERGIVQDKKIALTWKGINQDSVIYYTIERSMDTVNYKRIATINSQKGRDADYSYTDSPENQGINYYRFIAHLNNGARFISKTVIADVIFKNPSIGIYPVPVKDHILKLRLTRMDAGKYTVRLFQNDGKLVYSETINHTMPSNEYKIKVPVFASGLYQVEITNPKAVRKIKKVFIEK